MAKQPAEAGLIGISDTSKATLTSNIIIVTSEPEAELDKGPSDTAHEDARIQSTLVELVSSSYVTLATCSPKPDDPPPRSSQTGGKTTFHAIDKEGIAFSVGIVSDAIFLGFSIFVFAQWWRKRRDLKEVKCTQIQNPQPYDPNCSYFSLDTTSAS
jgi:hypothetical protein